MTPKPKPAPTTPPRSGYAYQRVSTGGQNADMQRAANLRYAADTKIPIHDEATDTASGSTPWASRTISVTLNHQPPTTDIVVYELSRIGRDLADTLTFFRECADRNITIHVSRTGMKIGHGIDGKIFATVLGLAADIEREFIVARTTDALAQIREAIKRDGSYTTKAGIVRHALGRPPGTTRPNKLNAHKDRIAELVAAQVSHAAIARILQVNRATLHRYLSTQTRRTPTASKTTKTAQ